MLVGEAGQDVGRVTPPCQQRRRAFVAGRPEPFDRLEQGGQPRRAGVGQHVVEDERADRRLRRVREADVVGESEVPPLPVQPPPRSRRSPPG